MTRQDRQFLDKYHIQQNLGWDDRIGYELLPDSRKVVPALTRIKTHQVSVEPEQQTAEHQTAGGKKEHTGPLSVCSGSKDDQRQDMKNIFNQEHIALQVAAESKPKLAPHQKVAEADNEENDQ